MGDQQAQEAVRENPRIGAIPLSRGCCSTKRHASCPCCSVGTPSPGPASRSAVARAWRAALCPPPSCAGWARWGWDGLRYAQAAATTAGRTSESGIGVRGSLWMGAEPKWVLRQQGTCPKCDIE